MDIQVEGSPFGGAGGGQGVQQLAHEAKQRLLVVLVEACEQGGGRSGQENRAGHELMFATNVLGRFLLTHELLPLLERGAPARVMVVTGSSPDRLNFDDLMARTDFKPFTQLRGRRPENAARALGALALDPRYESATGRFFKREKPADAPKNSHDSHTQQRLWAERQRLLGIA